MCEVCKLASKLHPSPPTSACQSHQLISHFSPARNWPTFFMPPPSSLMGVNNQFATEPVPGSSTIRMYFLPEGTLMTSMFPSVFLASSSLRDGMTMHLSPGVQFAGVATLCLAVICKESITRRISTKFRPVVAGYRMESLSFLSGPMMKTARAAIGSPAAFFSAGSSCWQRKSTQYVPQVCFRECATAFRNPVQAQPLSSACVLKTSTTEPSRGLPFQT
mmetsp:Transcript_30353/g.85766  ORF Transcript_30353/g.85766 Transcript_30353/m.85766 type:complete len:219 (-) Transcript_30353:449-1105(-)